MNPSISNFAEYARLALETVYTYGKQWRLVLPSLEHAQLSHCALRFRAARRRGTEIPRATLRARSRELPSHRSKYRSDRGDISSPTHRRSLETFRATHPTRYREAASLAWPILKNGGGVLGAFLPPPSVPIGIYRFQYPQPKNVANKGKTPELQQSSGASSGGWGIRTPEGLHPTRFPSVRHRPLGESSGA